MILVLLEKTGGCNRAAANAAGFSQVDASRSFLPG